MERLALSRWFKGHEKWAMWIAAIGACAAVVVALLSWSASNESSGRIERVLEASKPPPATKVVVYSTGDQLPDRAQAPRLFGNCVSGSSLTSNRADASRCFADFNGKNTLVFDPCFFSTPTFLEGNPSRPLYYYVCPRDPWIVGRNARAATVIALRDFEPGPNTPAFPHARPIAEKTNELRPWAVILANGVRCFAEGGATGTTGGLAHDYVCYRAPFSDSGNWPRGRDAGFLLDEPQRDRPTWTVPYQRRAAEGFTAVEVREAYQ